MIEPSMFLIGWEHLLEGIKMLNEDANVVVIVATRISAPSVHLAKSQLIRHSEVQGSPLFRFPVPP